MFDIGFFELLIIAVVGLVVIGPEKLPGTIRTCALWIGRVKRSISETRTEVEKQLGADEIRRELRNEQILHNLEKMRNAHSALENKIHQLGDESTNPPIEHDAVYENEDPDHHLADDSDGESHDHKVDTHNSETDSIEANDHNSAQPHLTDEQAYREDQEQAQRSLDAFDENLVDSKASQNKH